MEPTDHKSAPESAWRFEAPPPTFAASSGDGKRRFDGVAYSGDLVTGHWYWRAVVFDLSSTQAAKNVPALIEHDRSRRCGFGSLTIGPDIKINGQLLSNQHGKDVAQDADDGFPWQLSVHIEPGSIEEVAAGTTTTVNGRTFSGPLTVFRNNTIREVSFTPTGADDQTSARVFSRSTQPQPKEPAVADKNDETAALRAEVEGLKASVATLTTERDDARKDLAALKLSARTEQVKTLFKALGREFTPEAAKDYLEMPEAAFSVWAKDAATFSAKPAERPPLPTAFTKHTATEGPGGTAAATEDAGAIAQAAQAFHAEQAKAGNHITFAAAVQHVRTQKKAA